jgi:hypothetical protein
MGILEPRNRGLPGVLVPGRLGPHRRCSLTLFQHVDLPYLGGGQVIHDLPNGIAIRPRPPHSLFRSTSCKCFQQRRIIAIRPDEYTIKMRHQPPCQGINHVCFSFLYLGPSSRSIIAYDVYSSYSFMQRLPHSFQEFHMDRRNTPHYFHRFLRTHYLKTIYDISFRKASGKGQP